MHLFLSRIFLNADSARSHVYYTYIYRHYSEAKKIRRNVLVNKSINLPYIHPIYTAPIYTSRIQKIKGRPSRGAHEEEGVNHSHIRSLIRERQRDFFSLALRRLIGAAVCVCRADYSAFNDASLLQPRPIKIDIYTRSLDERGVRACAQERMCV